MGWDQPKSESTCARVDGPEETESLDHLGLSVGSRHRNGRSKSAGARATFYESNLPVCEESCGFGKSDFIDEINIFPWLVTENYGGGTKYATLHRSRAPCS